MNIIQVNNWTKVRGGIEMMVETTTHLLNQRGLNVSLLALYSQELALGFRGKVHAFISGFYSFSSRKLMHRLIISERADVIHVHNIYPFVSPSVLIECRQADVPIVLSIHSYFLTCPTLFHLRNGKVCEICLGGKEYWCAIKNCKGNIFESIGYALRTGVSRKFRLFHDNVTLFIALTDFGKERLIDAGFAEKNIVVLPNMVSIPDFPADCYHRFNSPPLSPI